MDPNQPDLIIPLDLFGRAYSINIGQFIIIFTSILYEALPFIILGALIAGILEELLPQRLVTRILPRSRVLAIGLGGMLGLIFPMCECGIIPVMRRLLRKGFPLSCCIAYLLAGPIINIIVLLSTAVAFSGMENITQGGRLDYQMGAVWMTSLRAGLAYLIAVGTALIVERQYQRHGNALLTPLARPSPLPLVEAEEGAPRPSLFQRLSRISETALHDFIDITVFLILGALLAAFVRQLLPNEEVARLSAGFPYMSILLLMALAFVLCLCSEADAFVAASFVTLRPSAKLAFLVLGPMLDIKLLFMYTRVFRPRLIWTIALAVIVQVFLYTTLTHFLWEHFAPRWMDPPAISTPSGQ